MSLELSREHSSQHLTDLNTNANHSANQRPSSAVMSPQTDGSEERQQGNKWIKGEKNLFAYGSEGKSD